MKYQFTYLSLFAAIITITWVACNKDTDIPSFADNCNEGLLGNTTINFKARHHSKTIPSLMNYPDTLFIKFNASDFPGEDPLDYDLVVAGAFPDSIITVENLNCGRYFVFMTGFDASIAQRVKGGIPVTLNEEQTLLNLDIPVTED